MALIRIVLAELPRMLRDIVSEAVEVHDDMRIVERAITSPNDVDVMVVGLQDGALPSTYATLMFDSPDLKVLGITGDARQIVLFELRPYRIELGDVSPGGLVSAIRERARVRTL